MAGPSWAGSTKTLTADVAEVDESKARNEHALAQLSMVAYGLNPYDVSVEGHKYGLPELPIPSDHNLKRRYDPIISQLTRLLMRDGKLSKAQRVSRKKNPLLPKASGPSARSLAWTNSCRPGTRTWPWC